MRIAIAVLMSAVVFAYGCGKAPQGTQDALPGAGSAGKMIQVKGSDTMVNLGQAWAEAYMEANPGSNIAVTGGGSGTGIAAMIGGTTDVAESSREMKDKEIALAKERGVNPIEHKVALDALSVIVHPSNPAGKLTIDQLSDIYTGKITNWKQVGGDDARIVLLSREKNSGTHVFFLEHVVRRGNEKGPEEYVPSALMLPSSEAIASQIATDKAAIGFVGLGYFDPARHKAIAVAKAAAGPFVKPDILSAVNGLYPVARPLFWYTRGEPQGEVRKLLDFVLSDEGQSIVNKLGFAPIRKV